MKKCVFSWFGYVLPLSERLRLIKDSGFEATCLWWEDETYPKQIPVDNMPSMVRQKGLYLDNIHCPYKGINNIWNNNSHERTMEIEKYINYVDACKTHDIPIMVMHATDEGLVNIDNKIGKESFKDIVDYAYKNNIRVAVENTRDVEIVDYLLENIKSPAFGLCYDSSHDWLMGQSKGKILEKWYSRLFATHLSDNDCTDDLHWIPLDGLIEWNNIIPMIKRASIECITLELLSSKTKIHEPEIYIKKAYDNLKLLLGGQS